MEEVEDRPLTSTRDFHPLEIPCITQHILQYLPHTDLKRTRLVSRTFKEEASRILKKKSKIVLNSPKRLIAFYLEKFESVDKFCECFQLINVHCATPSMKIFFGTYGSKVKSLDLRDSKWSCEELEGILTETMANTLEELTIHGAIPKDSTRLYFQKPKPKGYSLPPGGDGGTDRPVPKLPKIKRLDLQLFDKSPDEDPLKQFVIDILSSATNLEVLRSKDAGKWRNRRERFQRILFELLIDPELKLQFLKLRRVDFSISPWGDDQIHRLKGKRFPLSYLNLTILPAISINAVISLLISLRNTLTKLKLSFTYWRLTEFPCDMRLDKLNHLSLDWFNGSLSFVTRLINLRTLILAQVDLNELFTEEQVARFEKPHDLPKFEVYQHSGAVVLPSTVQQISEVFPSVTRLVLGKLGDASLRVVFSQFRLLEEFSAIEGAFGDSGITGIDIEACNVCSHKHLPELSKDVYNQDLVNQQRKHAFIGDLKNLRKLELKSPHMTNISVNHGIIYLKQLRSLTIWCYELTFRSLKKLVAKDNFNLEHLETTHSFTHRSEVQYALNQMRGRSFILNGLEAPKSSSFETFLNNYSESMCRSFVTMTVPRPQPKLNLLLVYEACMVEQNAIPGFMRLCRN